LTALDIVLAAALLCRQATVVKGMRHLPLIAAGILLPAVASPVMQMLWADYGAGNANYVFFQGVCLWLFCALGITEFTSAFLKLHNVKPP
jgi:hypothetical protein